MANILVTGGAGFIGSHIVDDLLDKGHNVTVIDNLTTGSIENLNSNSKLIEKSISDNLNDIFEKENFDYVFHLAAQINLRYSFEDPTNDARTNILGSLNIIDMCVKYGVKKLIFSSTGGAIYSKDAQLPCNENSSIKPESPYGLAKWTIENYLRIIGENKKLDYCILRYSNVYGPRQNAKGEAGVISIFIDNLMQDKDLNIFGDGNQTRDFVYVKDVVNANLLVLDKDLHGIYNVGTGKETSVNEIAQNLMHLSKKNLKINHKPAILGELKRSALNSTLLTSKGWNPGMDIKKGLEETYIWFKENEALL